MEFQEQDMWMIADAIDQVGESLVWVDKEGNFLKVNKTALEKSGYSGERMKCMSIFDFCDSISPDEWPNYVRLLQINQYINFECKLFMNHGQIVPMQVTIRQPEYGDHLLIILNDFDIYRENSMLDRLKKEFNELTYRFTHDLRSPLSTLRGLINLMRIEGTPAQQPYLDKMEQSVRKQSDIMSNMYLLACTHRGILHPGPVQFDSLIRELIKEIHHSGDDVQWTMEGNETQGFYGDHEMLALLLQPILKNAIDFGGEECRVQIRLESVKEGVNLEIQDNGQGIDKTVQSKIFEMFYRGTVRSNGSGLGLYIARSAAARIGAQITFSTSVEGTTFFIHIPHTPAKQYELFPG